MEENQPAESEDLISNGDDVDPDALAYIRAKKKVDVINKIKKHDKSIKV